MYATCETHLVTARVSDSHAPLKLLIVDFDCAPALERVRVQLPGLVVIDQLHDDLGWRLLTREVEPVHVAREAVDGDARAAAEVAAVRVAVAELREADRHAAADVRFRPVQLDVPSAAQSLHAPRRLREQSGTARLYCCS